MASLDIVVDNPELRKDISEGEGTDRDSALVSWIMDKVSAWEDHRDSNYKKRWDEYYRLWRGLWAQEDKVHKSERSKIIAPALQQAIESAVAEIEEATFGKGRWYDIIDEVGDPNPNDVKIYRDNLHDELDLNGARANISESFLNGAIFGTGIGKIVVDEEEFRVPAEAEVVPGTGIGVADSTLDSKIKVRLVPVHPNHFVIDPEATSIDEALGCAHIIMVPTHNILRKQANGEYKAVDIGGPPDDISKYLPVDEQTQSRISSHTKVVEWHGLIPASLLDEELGDGAEFVELFPNGEVSVSEDDLVESIVTIANDSVVLKAVKNPNFMQDRAFIAYQHDTVPSRFWGRGVAEKGYNPQKALDAEMRGRIDAMAFSIRPMMGIDATRIPRGSKFGVEAGRNVYTNGDPSQILKPFVMGQVGPETFHQSGELERMVQMGTGSMDSATPVGINPRNSTASGMSMILGGAIKRNKRTMANIERSFLSQFIKKAAWRYMQFDPARFPVKDIKFKVISTLGIMARELEQAQLSQLLQTTQPGSPAYWMLIKSIYENSSITDREAMIALATQQLQQSLQPPQPSPAEQAAMQKNQVDLQVGMMRAQADMLRARADILRAQMEATRAPSNIAKNVSEAQLNAAKAASEEASVGIKQINALMDGLMKSGQLAQLGGADAEDKGNTESDA